MQTEEAQKTWTDYYERKKSERLEQAATLWNRMRAAGVTDDTVLALDFVHFGPSRADIEALAAQLAENYAVTVAPAEEQGYWLAKGTTRPNGITLEQDQHVAWVEFMADVAQSFACVFSTWALEAPALSVRFESGHAGAA